MGPAAWGMASLSAERMCPQHAPCPPHRAPLCPLPVCVRLCPATNPSGAPTTYRSEARLPGWALDPSLPPQLCLYFCVVLRGRAQHCPPPTRCVSWVQGGCICPRHPRAPLTCAHVGLYCQHLKSLNTAGVPNAIFSFSVLLQQWMVCLL